MVKCKKPMSWDFIYLLFKNNYLPFHKLLQCCICFTDCYMHDFQTELSNINKSALSAIYPAMSKLQKLNRKPTDFILMFVLQSTEFKKAFYSKYAIYYRITEWLGFEGTS